MTAAHAEIKHICIKCGAEFQGGARSKYCPECRKDYQNDYHRRKLGWTEEEIRLGHRIK